MRIAQISDLHIRRESARDARQFDRWLTDCIAHVNAVKPDIVLTTGDLTDSGEEEEYRRLRELMRALDAPYYVMPGNHDDALVLQRAYSDHAYLSENEGHASYTVDAGPVRIIALDSTKRHRAGGYLDARRLEWLSAQLRIEPERAVLLALHHPPFAAGVWPMDWLGYTNLDRLAAMVRANPQIKRAVSGHVHCFRSANWAGTIACTSPSTRPQRLVVGVGWQFPKLYLEQPGFLMHSVEDGGTIRTSVHRMNGALETL